MRATCSSARQKSSVIDVWCLLGLHSLVSTMPAAFRASNAGAFVCPSAEMTGLTVLPHHAHRHLQDSKWLRRCCLVAQAPTPHEASISALCALPA